MAFFDDELRKLQQQRAQLDAYDQAQQAALDYENKARAAQEAQSQQKPGGLGGVLAGIGESIGNVGKGLAGIFGGGIANIGDIATSIATGKATNKNKEDFDKWLAGTDNLKDARIKNAGAALDAAATVSDLIPGLGTAAKVGLNVGQGVASGVAQQMVDKGGDFTLEDALKGGTIGGLSAGAGQAVGAGLAKGLPGNNRVARALNTNIGRGALTGAASGAVGGGVATALEGGNLGQTLSGALQGAGSGALSGGAMAGLYDLAGAGYNKLRDRNNVAEAPTDVVADQNIPEGTRKRQTPTGWAGEDLTGEAKKQNYLQKLGGDLQDAAQQTRDSAIYGKLKGNTADEMIQKDAINNLRKNYGYAPDDYEQASKLSTAINKWYDNEIQTSGADKVNAKLSNDLALPVNNTLPEKYEKAYTETIRNALNMANAGDSNVIDKYSASGLERAAKYLGEQEQKLRRTNMNGVGGRPDGDRAELADYYATARKALRNEVNSMIELDDITKGNLEKLLDNAGATQQAKDAILSAKTFSEVKSATSPLEDARTMQRQMQSSGLKRSASGDNSLNVTTQLANKTGLTNLVDVAGKPLRSAAAGAENIVGKAISGIGDAVAGDKTGLVGKAIGTGANLAKTATQAPQLELGPVNLDNIVNRQIAREAGQAAAKDVQIANEQAAAQKAATEAQNNFNAANANYQNAVAQGQQMQMQMSQGAQQLQTLSDAMDRALAAGDIKAYSQLADLYQQAYKIYGADLEATQSNGLGGLTNSQLENINKLDTAGNAIDELEALFQKAGGGQGLIGGNATNFMASLGLNPDASTYNALSRGLINQIGAAIGKTDSLNTEGEVQRAMELIPAFTDDAQTASNKLAQLRQMLQTNKQTVYQNYGVKQTQ